MRYKKYLKKKNNNMKVSAIFLFLIGMAVLTVIARIADSFMIPQVNVSSLEEKKLEYPIEIEGQIKAKGVRAIYCKEDLRIENVFVQQNDMVQKGDLLFSIDKEKLELQIKKIEQEISKYNLQIEDLQNTYDKQINQKNQNVKRAEEDYNEILNVTKNAVDIAYMEMEHARQELVQHDSVKPQEREEQEERNQNLGELEREQDKIKREKIKQQEENKIQLQGIEQEDIESKREEQNEIEQQNMEQQENLFAEWIQKRAELEENYYEKQKNYEDAVASRQEAIKSASRQIEDADQEIVKDHSVVFIQIEKKNLEYSLQELYELRQVEGKIYSEFDGRISECGISVGSITTSEPVFLLEDFSSSFQFEGSIEEPIDFNIEEGMECIIEMKSKNILLERVKISKVIEEEQGTYQIKADIDSDVHPKVGKAILKFTKKSKNYANCVPLSALYHQATGYYVIRIKEDITILGVQAVAEYVPVTLLEKNNEYAAVDGMLLSSDEIVVNASKEIKEGERVRILEE